MCLSLSPSPWRRSVSESYFKTKGSDGIQIQPRVLLELFTYFFFFYSSFFGAEGWESMVFALTVYFLTVQQRARPLGEGWRGGGGRSGESFSGSGGTAEAAEALRLWQGVGECCVYSVCG